MTRITTFALLAAGLGLALVVPASAAPIVPPGPNDSVATPVGYYGGYNSYSYYDDGYRPYYRRHHRRHYRPYFTYSYPRYHTYYYHRPYHRRHYYGGYGTYDGY